MKLKISVLLGAALALYALWFFISHAYVFVRLTAVLGFLVVAALFVIAIVAFRGNK